ncbi:Ferredoxin-type protein NapF [Sporomusa rhizae]|uniref:4Fe-4S binding protein n=1 Tax=Sporomusa rhizae TaxID=357999 RepID=UPI00352B9E9F
MTGMIVRNEAVCLNNRYKKMDCHRCRQICPQGCSDQIQGLDLAKCDECGLCLAVCPAEAIAGVSYSPLSINASLSSTDSMLYLTCTRQDRQSDWPCLGFIDTYLLLAFVYSGSNSNRQVIVDNRHCFTCKPKVARYLQELCNSLEPVLKYVEKKPLLKGKAAGEYKRKEQVISRRDLIKCLFGEAKKVIAEAVQSNEHLMPLPRRQIFANYVENSAFTGMAPTRLFSAITISDSCHACGLCGQLCPNQAIVVKKQQSVLEFYQLAYKCTSCGVCAINCPRQAIIVTLAESLEMTHIATRTLPQCKKCGNLYQPVGDSELCFDCFLEANRGF